MSLALGLAACAVPGDEESTETTDEAFTATFSSPSWKPIVSCDSGAMTIDVNTKERRELRVVVHDVAIAKWVGNGQYESTYASNRCGVTPFKANPCVATNGDLELPATTQSAVFTSSSFSWLRGAAQLSTGERLVEFTAWRDGAGIRLEKMSDVATRQSCDHSGSGSCGPIESVSAPKIIYADWYFRSCQNLP